MNIALIIAGGVGNRMGQDIPKQFLNVRDKPVIVYTMERFQRCGAIDVIAVVCIEGWETMLRAYANQFEITKLKHIIPGGRNGQESIRNGVEELMRHYGENDVVLVHDAIRPMVSETIIEGCAAATKKYGNAVTIVPCQEAMLETEDGETATKDFPRDNLKRTQTPQGFYLGDLAWAHKEALKRGITNSIASCTLMTNLGERIYFCPGSEKNIKLTTVDDIEIFKALLAAERDEWLK
ncbi:MAG: 2-C-methyl-D-erythritol 4-phosphate cytidylyltransferase [Clostridia bacterium]|nr:2-C-methyl-D-erythritol 4-phosphate cytidylyltransferase [Clostridia bacterium]